MALIEQVDQAKRTIVSDGYDMSVGEIANLYRDGEIIINPEFQRLYRWDIGRKTTFIESLLLGIPTPPIFVYQNEKGAWELIDGLQRLSTIFQFMGILKNPPEVERLALEGTKNLPDLAGAVWERASQQGESEIDSVLKLQIKRTRIRVEILKNESDAYAKYDLFRRLNTGGLPLSEQEVRNCIAVMLDKQFYEWMCSLARYDNFKEATSLSEKQLDKSLDMELVLRFLAYRNVGYSHRIDVHEYLERALINIVTDSKFDREKEEDEFNKTFGLLAKSLGDKTFKRYDGNDFKGSFLISAYDVVALGLSKRLDKYVSMDPAQVAAEIKKKIVAMWGDTRFTDNSGSGVRGTTRLANLVPVAESFF